MFNKILIANRGEIAVRIIRTCNRLGIGTVAVYSDADSRSLHRHLADEAVHIGPPAAAESYLVIDKIVQACKDTGAEAVHPGYGFLSEREAFPKALAKAGITFIGPNAKAIAAMGDKIESKKAAAKAKVSTVPGHLGIAAKGLDYAGATPQGKAALKVFSDQVAQISPAAYKLQGYVNNRVIFNAVISRLGQAISGEGTLDEAYRRIESDIAQQIAERKK